MPSTPWYQAVPIDPPKNLSPKIPACSAFAAPSSSPSPRPGGSGFNSAEAAGPLVSPRRGQTATGKVINHVETMWPVPSNGWPIPPVRKGAPLPAIKSDLELSPEVLQVWEQCMDPKTPLTYMALGYEHGSRSKVVLIGSGDDGFTGLRTHFSDAQHVVYGTFQVRAAGAPRHVFICSIGPHAGALVKEQCLYHHKDVHRQLSGVAADLFVTEEEERHPAAVASSLSATLQQAVRLDPHHKEWHADFFERNLQWQGEKQQKMREEERRVRAAQRAREAPTPRGA